MPQRLLLFLEKKSLETHFCFALLFGFVVRTLTAYFVYGPLAMDDIIHGLNPTTEWIEGKVPVDLSPYRSPLLVWLLGFFLKIGMLFGVTTRSVGAVRCIGIFLGLLSLLCVFGTYLYVRAQKEERPIFGIIAIYLSALHFIMPLLGTRMFGETVCMPFLILGVALIESGSIFGLVLIGIATLFRFQVGLLFVLYSGYLFYRKRSFWIFPLAILFLGIESAIDWGWGRAPMSTLVNYFIENKNVGADYGRQPWYTHLLAVLIPTLPPFSLVLIPGIRPMIKKHRLLFAAVALFTLAHSVISHKEERFLFPIIPLCLILLASAWTNTLDRKWTLRFYFPIFCFLNTLVLALATFNNSQSGDLAPAVDFRSHYETGVCLETEPILSSSFLPNAHYLKQPLQYRQVENEKINEGLVNEIFSSQKEVQGILVVTRHENGGNLNLLFYRCDSVKRGSSFLDSVIYHLNPKRNVRRRPVYYVICHR